MFLYSQNFARGAYQEDGSFIPTAAEEKDLRLDEYNHGTMCAGIVQQYAGKRNVRLLNLKVSSARLYTIFRSYYKLEFIYF